jgi:3',5'-cyclic AMP phosphodiesterase CpdA
MRGFVALSTVWCVLGCPSDDGSSIASTSGTGDATTSSSSSTEATSTTTGSSEATGSDASDSSSSTGDRPEPLPPLSEVPRTIDQTITPTHAIDPEATLDPRLPEQRQQLLDEGYGDYELGPGESIVDVTPDGGEPPMPGASPSRLSRFVHLADTQIADDESPLRVVTFDTPSLSGAFRPQEDHGCHMTNAAVRTINAVHADTPLDFVVLGGDNIDAAQHNELSWFLAILDGRGAVHCDSGDDDDPEPGEGNDAKDRFTPVGLDVPWVWVTGNHDALVQGNFVVQGREAIAVGTEVPSGGATRDWSAPGGPAFVGPVVADDDRALLDGPALLGLVQQSGDGHGVTPAVVESGRATFGWDAPGSDLRVVVVDTASPTGASEGLVTDRDVDELIRPALDAAEADDKLVIVATHHASTSLGDGGGLGGMTQDDALTTADWQALLGEYPNVIAHIAGHSHEHRVAFIEPAGYWEIITSAIADWPQQMRVVELHDQDNGWLTITSVALDFATEGDALGEQARALAITDLTSGWTDSEAAGTPQDRNVRLWIELP